MEHIRFLHITYRVWKSLQCPCEKAKNQKCNKDWRKSGFDMNGELLSASLCSWGDYLWPPENSCPKSPSGLHMFVQTEPSFVPPENISKKRIHNLQRSETPSMHLDCKKHWNWKQNVTSLCENTGSLEVLKIQMFWFFFFYQKKVFTDGIKDSFKSADLILPSAEYRNAFSRMFFLFLFFLTWSCVGLVRHFCEVNVQMTHCLHSLKFFLQYVINLESSKTLSSLRCDAQNSTLGGSIDQVFHVHLLFFF